ncbi:MAG: aminopeptidase N [Beijerinckiaceae bacterium]|nr:aminopeptidase N [Beijerinckiaceae bacterium]
MRTDTPQVVRLSEYKKPDWLIDDVHLDVTLDDGRTRVIASISLRMTDNGTDGPLVLDGDELVLESIAIDGNTLPASAYRIGRKTLTLLETPKVPFVLTIITLLDPAANTQLMGLYKSSGIYCTQCEAEGFRRITYFLDRPDVMAIYTTRITAYKADAPILLGNGNKIQSGDLADGWHYAVWHDPHPKPSYLFALVAGNLGKVGGSFTTRSGKPIELGIYVESGKENRASYALDALIRSMKWDEEIFNCEYDLDVFNIVAVSDFNMGAMENKGLNVFNDKYILASPETATDSDYANIEAIIAHEYFHNWTGNRITCRDWFQLCLKEGLTVYRDQEFSADERSRAVKRIADVKTLRSQQFTEDSGPLAHPVRPTEYREINNFYTPTVYEKGAEIIRMLKTLIGKEKFREGIALYFSKYDGTAATIEEFLTCFAKVSNRDLAHFAKWYDQAGTPRVSIVEDYNPEEKYYKLIFSQKTFATPGQPIKEPLVIPIELGFINQNGTEAVLKTSHRDYTNNIFVLTEASSELIFNDVSTKPILSALRGFSAPVILETNTSDDDRLVLLSYDSDTFNRWQAVQGYAMKLLISGADQIRSGQAPQFDPRFAEALSQVLKGDDHAFIAQLLTLPSEGDIAREISMNIEPDSIRDSRYLLKQFIGKHIGRQIEQICTKLTTTESYRPDAEGSGRRALRNVLLDILSTGYPEIGLKLTSEQYQNADNMTDRFAALSIIAQHAGDVREDTLNHFAQIYGNDPLVLDKWFSLQAAIPEDGTLARVLKLMEHPGFSARNPNRLRSLVGSFAASNLSQFNRKDGAGYEFVSKIVIQTDLSNPQVAARLLGAFKTWRSLEPKRRSLAQTALQTIERQEKLSPDVSDIVMRTLAEN